MLKKCLLLLALPLVAHGQSGLPSNETVNNATISGNSALVTTVATVTKNEQFTATLSSSLNSNASNLTTNSTTTPVPESVVSVVTVTTITNDVTLSNSEIAAIVIGALGLVGVALLILFCCRKRHDEKDEILKKDQMENKQSLLYGAKESSPLKGDAKTSADRLKSGNKASPIAGNGLNESMQQKPDIGSPFQALSSGFSQLTAGSAALFKQITASSGSAFAAPDVENQAMLTKDSMRSGSSEDLMSDANKTKPAIEVGLAFNVDTSKLTIRIGKATLLNILAKTGEYSSSLETYATVFLVAGDKADVVLLETRTSYQFGSSPYYNETFTFELGEYRLSEVGVGILIYNGADENIGWLAIGSVANTVHSKHGVAHWNELKAAAATSKGGMVTRHHVIRHVRTTSEAGQRVASQ